MKSNFKPGDIVKSTGTGLVYTIIGDVECSRPTMYPQHTKGFMCSQCDHRLYVGIVTDIEGWRQNVSISPERELFRTRNICWGSVALVASIDEVENENKKEIVP